MLLRWIPAVPELQFVCGTRCARYFISAYTFPGLRPESELRFPTLVPFSQFLTTLPVHILLLTLYFFSLFTT